MADSKNTGDIGEAEEKLIRHHLPDRLLHWIMAISVFGLLITSFIPIMGIKFSWVTLHWGIGLVLILAILAHIARIIFWQDIRSMWISFVDLHNAWKGTKQALTLQGEGAGKPGKYPLMQKLFHHSAALSVLATVVTGLLMMVKIDTPFWQRDPYWLPDDIWGLTYILHDLSAMGLIPLIMLHIYFAVRPENIWLTRSMFHGWISRKNYLPKYDPERWKTKATDITSK